MTIEQIIAWLSGPGLSVAISAILENNTAFQKWTPQGRSILTTLLTLLSGYAAWYIGAHVPAAQIAQLDPAWQALFPLLSYIVGQAYHTLTKAPPISTQSAIQPPTGKGG